MQEVPQSSIQIALISQTLETMRKINSDQLDRREKCITSINQLAKGVFYYNDYLQDLKVTKQNKRLEWFSKKPLPIYADKKKFHIKTQVSAGGKERLCISIKEGTLPTVALESITEGLSLLGCGEITQLSQYAAIRKVLGDKKFNALFAAETETPFTLGTTHSNPIATLRNYILQSDAQLSEYKVGDSIYVANASSYLQKHPTGGACGFNVFCQDVSSTGKTFIAFGLPKEGMTLDELNQKMIECYNEESSTPINPLRAKQINLKEYKQEGGGKVTIVSELHFKRIEELVKKSAEEGQLLLKNWTTCQGKGRLK